MPGGAAARRRWKEREEGLGEHRGVGREQASVWGVAGAEHPGVGGPGPGLTLLR